jgi:hypothetical protein
MKVLVLSFINKYFMFINNTEGLMERKRWSLVGGLKTCVSLIFFMSLAASVLWMLAWPISGFTGSRGWDVNIPVALGERSVLPVLPLELSQGGLQESASVGPSLRLVNAVGELRFQTTNPRLSLFFWAVVILYFGLLILGLHLLRKMLDTTAEGRPFDPSNVRRLSSLGWIILAAGLAGPILRFSIARWVLSDLPATGIPLSPPLRADGEWIICGLLVLILSGIWGEAVQMAEDQSLTV